MVFGLPPELSPYMGYIAAFTVLVIAWSLAAILYEGALNRRNPWLVWVRGILLLAAAAAVGIFLALNPGG